MSYLTLLVPKISFDNAYLKSKQENTPKLHYLTIYNPEYIKGKGELDEELIDQIFCFISQDKLDAVEQIKIIGLIQAMEGLCVEFGDKQSNYKIIKASNSTIMVKQLPNSFTLACSISMPENSIKQSAINHQMIQLLDMSYDFFKLLNTSFDNIISQYNVDILKNLMGEHWSSFFTSYNYESFKFPSTVKWSNSLNYMGFLGLFNNLQQSKLYKKSSLDTNYNLKYEIDKIIQNAPVTPKGVIISCFGKTMPKQYGLVFCDSVYDNELEDYSIAKHDLIDIYKYLEYFDYHEKLNTVDLVRLSNEELFSSANNVKQNFNVQVDLEELEDTESSFFRDSANYAKDMLNPLTLTNNLVILPINFTVNSMMNMTIAEPSSWLKIPSYLRFLANESELVEPSYELEAGHYIVGLVEKEGVSIERKLVYLDTKTHQGQIEQEYLLVIYERNGITMTLVYDSSIPDLDDQEFYHNLKNSVIVPALDEVNESLSGIENLEASVGSLKSVSDKEKAGENRFFFVVYDQSENHIKSSLPYLPLPISQEEVLNSPDKSKLNIRSAMFYLHDQLLDLFFLQNTPFFKEDGPKEYFHKFSTNKINDWMFYYVKYEEKYIIIIKNMNHNSRKKMSQRSIGEEHPEFLENLDDDIKVWFENFITHGTT